MSDEPHVGRSRPVIQVQPLPSAVRAVLREHGCTEACELAVNLDPARGAVVYHAGIEVYAIAHHQIHDPARKRRPPDPWAPLRAIVRSLHAPAPDDRVREA